MVGLALGTFLLEKIGEKGIEAIAGKSVDSVVSHLSNSEDINARFRKAIDLTSQKLENTYKDILGNSLSYFFGRKEVFNELLKLLFYDSNISIDIIENEFDTATLPSGFIFEFINSLKSELYKDEIIAEILRNKELLILTKGLSNDVNSIVQNTTLLKDEVSSIVSLLENKLRDSFDYENFNINYTQNIINNLSQVHFVGLGIDSSIRKSRKTLHDIFIKPFFIAPDDCIENYEFTEEYPLDDDQDLSIDDNKMLIHFDDLFKIKNNVVILGNPGTGKSLLIRYLICMLLADKNNNITPLNSLPFRIELRKYIAFKKQNGGNFLNYLIYLLSFEYNIQNLTIKNLEFIIRYKNTVFFFDGLDEIFNINDKISAKNDIENFYSIYKVRIFTTSRIIGYEDAKLNEVSFIEISIQNFTEKQIEEYVNKWYLQEENDETIREREVEEFLTKKSALDRELIRNPLLLSLIVILFRNNLKLPESKLEIYQSCTKTLVDKWDETKELKIDLTDTLLKKKETIFADLAYWQYVQLSTDNENIKITYDKAKNTIAETIIKKIKLTDEWIEAQEFAEDFMVYAEKRSLYFDNNFTHKTFLEYFTAYWIYSNCDKKQRSDLRNEIIAKYVDNAFWSIVLELLFNMIDNDQPDTEIIDELYGYLYESDIKSTPFLLNLIPSIKNISSIAIRGLFYNAVKFSLNEGIVIKSNPLSIHERESKLHNIIFERVSDLIYSNSKYLSLFNEAFLKLYDNIENTLKNNYFIYYLELTHNQSKQSKYSIVLPTEIFKSNEFINLLKTDSYAYTLNNLNNRPSLSLSGDTYLEDFISFLKIFGIEEVFIQYASAFNFVNYVSAFNRFCFTQFTEGQINNFEINMSKIEAAGLNRVHIYNKLLGGIYANISSASMSLIVFKILDDIKEPYNLGIILLLLLNVSYGNPERINMFYLNISKKTYHGKHEEILEELRKLRSFKLASERISNYIKEYKFNN